LSLAARGWYALADRARLAWRRRSAPQRPGYQVSVPIATYDRIDVLVDRTIPTLLAQSHDDIEIIIVGDGTPQELWRRVEALTDPRIRSRRLRSRTRYPDDPISLWMVAGWRARNVGAQMATGDWILWMSDDDILPARSIDALLDVVRRRPEVELVSGVQQAGLERPRRTTLENTDHGLPVRVIGMPLLCRSTLAAFRWNRHSWRKSWNRPCDFDLLERMGRLGVTMDVSDELVVIHPEVSDTGLIGSQGAIAEELSRRARGEAQPG
jgi:glycosyltransferase involved in cell wall biosynthesis